MGNLVQFAAVCFLVCLSNVLGGECPDSVKRRIGYKTTFKDKCYLFVAYEEKWLKADSSCRGWGGNLISIPDMATMNFVKDVMNRRLNWTTNVVWIGANDRRGHGWEWTTGEKIKWGYWASGQPGKTQKGFSYEDCGLMRRGDGWRWHDYRILRNGFYHKYRFICQFGTDSSQVQGSLAGSGTRAESDRDTGIVIGCIGGIILVTIFIMAILFLRRRRRKQYCNASGRFQNMSYMHINRQSPDHATASNVYVDANTKLAPKKTNIEIEQKRVVDPNKPSNLQNQEQMYENTTGGSTEESIQGVEGYEEPVSAPGNLTDRNQIN